MDGVASQKEIKLSNNFSRFAAYLIDTSILAIPNVIVLIFLILYILVLDIYYPGNLKLNILHTTITVTAILLGVLILILNFLYYSHFLSKKGQTWGMSYLGIKLKKEDGNLLSFKEALLRHTVYSVLPSTLTISSLIPIFGPILTIPLLLLIPSYLYCFYDKKRQNIYDKIHDVIYISVNENYKRIFIAIAINLFGLFLIALLFIILIFTYLYKRGPIQLF